MNSFAMYLVGLTAAFVALDITGKIDWSWWVIVLPLLAAIGFGLLGIVVKAVNSASE